MSKFRQGLQFVGSAWPFWTFLGVLLLYSYMMLQLVPNEEALKVDDASFLATGYSSLAVTTQRKKTIKKA